MSANIPIIIKRTLGTIELVELTRAGFIWSVYNTLKETVLPYPIY